MTRLNIPSGSEYENLIGFSRAVRIGNIIAVSGTAPIAGNGSTAFPGDLYNQTRRCLEIMAQSIAKAGGSLEDVIRTRIYLRNISRWAAAAKAHGEFFAEIKPTCTFVEVAGLIQKEWMVETEADCVVMENT